MSKLYHIRSPNIRKIYFCGTFSCFMGITCLHTQTKSILAVSLTGQPSFYCPRFTRYGFCDFFALPGYFRCSRKSYSLAANSGGDSTFPNDSKISHFTIIHESLSWKSYLVYTLKVYGYVLDKRQSIPRTLWHYIEAFTIDTGINDWNFMNFMPKTYAFLIPSSIFMIFIILNRLQTVHTANTADQNPESSYSSQKLCNYRDAKILPDR